MYGGILSLTYSYLYHCWHFPTMVGFCHGGIVLGIHHHHHHHEHQHPYHQVLQDTLAEALHPIAERWAGIPLLSSSVYGIRWNVRNLLKNLFCRDHCRWHNNHGNKNQEVPARGVACNTHRPTFNSCHLCHHPCWSPGSGDGDGDDNDGAETPNYSVNPSDDANFN